MTTTPEPRRRYDSPRRRAQAAATRRDILDAAQRLFERDGYQRTSMTAVAREAGVSVKTVYLAFETKRGMLLALWHLLLRGDEESDPVGERPWFREVVDEPDPRRLLQLNARNSRRVKERVGPLLEVVRDAAATEPELEALWARIQLEYHDNQRTVVEALHRRRALRPGLGVPRATDALWALNHPDVYRLLVGSRGWSPAEYERWVADTSCAQLLREQPPRPSSAA